MDQVSLRAKPRTEFGSRIGRRLRRTGAVPAILYGRGVEPVSVAVDRRELYAALHTEAGTNAIINLEVTGTKKPFLTVAREIQRHPVRGEIAHVDFISISLDEEIHAEVALEFVGLPIGVKRDAGIVETIRNSVNISALPLDIPGHITFDISHLEVNMGVKVSELPVLKGVRYLDEPELDLVQVIIPRITIEAVPVEVVPEEGAEGVEGAVPAAEGTEAAKGTKPTKEAD
jgi:large subunit ribosomal protein L25